MGWYEQLQAPVKLLADNLLDIETTRIGIGHRLSAFQRSPYPQPEPLLATLQSLHDGLLVVENEAVSVLQKAMRKHPLGPWVKANKGLGEKTIARALGAIGNPYWNHAENRPRRGPAELWAYCGYHVLPTSSQRPADAHTTGAAGGEPFRHPDDHDGNEAHGSAVVGVAPRRAKGERANWNSDARKRLWLCAKAVEKLPSGTTGYRDLYDQARAHEEGRDHDAPCPQCGVCDTCGKPPGMNKLDHAETGCTDRRVRKALPGDPLKDGHRQARALRKVAKAILADMWREARDWHEQALD